MISSNFLGCRFPWFMLRLFMLPFRGDRMPPFPPFPPFPPLFRGDHACCCCCCWPIIRPPLVWKVRGAFFLPFDKPSCSNSDVNAVAPRRSLWNNWLVEGGAFNCKGAGRLDFFARRPLLLLLRGGCCCRTFPTFPTFPTLNSAMPFMVFAPVAPVTPVAPFLRPPPTPLRGDNGCCCLGAPS